MDLHFWQHVKSVVTREFSRNPSSTLRDAQDGPVLITKYGQPIACLASIDYWNSLLKQAQNGVINGDEPGSVTVECLSSGRPLPGDSRVRD